jgi:hypothetical protein
MQAGLFKSKHGAEKWISFYDKRGSRDSPFSVINAMKAGLINSRFPIIFI